MKKICLIDGSGFIFRAFHALPMLNTNDGTPVNAVYGFTKSVMSLKESQNVDYMAVVFDASRITFRQKVYSEYKANRPSTPEELIPQFSLVRKITKALNIASLEMDGFEADDLIATYAKIASLKGIAVEIISSDKDLMQLVDDSKHIYMYDAFKKKVINEKEVFKKFSVMPSQVIDAQSLIGDSVDNVPGVKGIGPKGAADLINTFGSLEEIYNNIDKISKKGLKEKLVNNKEMAFISKSLVSLNCNISVDIKLEDLIIKEPDIENLCSLFEELSFHSLAAKIAKKNNISLSSNPSGNALQIHNNKQTEIENKEEVKIVEIYNCEQLSNLRKKINNCRYISLIHHTDKDSQLSTVSLFGNNTTESYFIHINNIDITNQSLFIKEESKHDKLITEFYFFTELTDILKDKSVLKITYNVKELMHIASKYDITINSYDDLEQMSYLLDGVNNDKNKISYLIKNNFFIEEYQKDTDLPAYLVHNLYELYKEKIVQKQLKFLYETFDKPLLKVLFTMEKAGIKIDHSFLGHLSSEFSQELKNIEQKIFDISGENFNIGSPKQLGEILFEKMKLKGSKNKTGSWKTDILSLESLKEEGHLIIDLILKWRQLSKLKNTYTDKLPEKINSSTNRIHTTYLLCSTLTGRLSSINPNLQNIPIRTSEGKKIRKSFIARPNYKIVSLDYSQIELRILASIGSVKSLISSFKNKQDIHNSTASEIFQIPINEVTPEIRRQAKAINFGIIYGQTPYGLSSHLGISIEHAKKYIDFYFNRYPEIKEYMDATITMAKKKGFVDTLFNRKCYIDGIHASNLHKRNFAERTAINARIQGTGADIIRKALIDVNKFLITNKANANLLLQIHDEVIIEAHDSIAQEITLEVKKIMENTCDIGIPLDVDYKIGNSWLDN